MVPRQRLLWYNVAQVRKSYATADLVCLAKSRSQQRYNGHSAGFPAFHGTQLLSFPDFSLRNIFRDPGRWSSSVQTVSKWSPPFWFTDTLSTASSEFITSRELFTWSHSLALPTTPSGRDRVLKLPLLTAQWTNLRFSQPDHQHQNCRMRLRKSMKGCSLTHHPIVIMLIRSPLEPSPVAHWPKMFQNRCHIDIIASVPSVREKESRSTLVR